MKSVEEIESLNIYAQLLEERAGGWQAGAIVGRAESNICSQVSKIPGVGITKSDEDQILDYGL